MAQNIALQSLINERDKLISAKAEAIANFDKQILEFDNAIDEISGKKYWGYSDTLYDDENPDYIKSSLEEI